VDSPLSLIRSYRVLGHCAGNRIPRQEAGALDDAALASASATTSSGESVGLLSSVHWAKSTGCPFPLCTRRNNGYPRRLWMVSWTHQTSDITDQNSGKTVIVSNPSSVTPKGHADPDRVKHCPNFPTLTLSSMLVAVKEATVRLVRSALNRS